MNNLALQVRGPNLRPARNRAAAMEGRNAMMTNRLNHMKLMEAEDAMAQKSQIRNALAQKPNASYEEMAGIHRQAGDVQGALAIDKAALDWQTGKSNLQKADSERFKNQLDIFGQVADNIVDDRTKQQAIGQMLEAGVISEDRAKQLWTTPYSPELVEGWKRGALTAKDRISQDFQNEKFEYQKGQDATTNAREDEKLALQRQKAANTGNKESLDSNKFEFQVAKQHRNDSKAFKEVSSATSRLIKALDKAPLSAPATLAAATAFMKMLDPGSVVRESELGAALSATGLVDRVTNLAKQTDYGRVMTVRQQKQFMDLAREFYAESERAQRQVDKEYTDLAGSYGLSPDNIISDYYLPEDIFPKDTAPMDGAVLAPDGNWYIQKEDGVYKVEP